MDILRGLDIAQYPSRFPSSVFILLSCNLDIRRQYEFSSGPITVFKGKKVINSQQPFPQKTNSSRELSFKIIGRAVTQFCKYLEFRLMLMAVPQFIIINFDYTDV